MTEIVTIGLFYVVLAVIGEVMAMCLFAKEHKAMVIITIIIAAIGTIAGANTFIEANTVKGTMKVVFGVLSATMVAFAPPIAVDMLIIKISEHIKERKFFY